jgi:hypothetical protein
MAIDKPKNNLYKIPHLSTMTYEDIKAFEQNGITPRNPNRIKGGSDGQREQQAAGQDPVG